MWVRSGFITDETNYRLTECTLKRRPVLGYLLPVFNDFQQTGNFVACPSDFYRYGYGVSVPILENYLNTSHYTSLYNMEADNGCVQYYIYATNPFGIHEEMSILCFKVLPGTGYLTDITTGDYPTMHAALSR